MVFVVVGARPLYAAPSHLVCISSAAGARFMYAAPSHVVCMMAAGGNSSEAESADEAGPQGADPAAAETETSDASHSLRFVRIQGIDS
jgi:hypothetical protein